MSLSNKISNIPFKDDKVIDVQFFTGNSFATIYFSSGKVLIIHINDDGNYTRMSYMEDVTRNNRNLNIKKILRDSE